MEPPNADVANVQIHIEATTIHCLVCYSCVIDCSQCHHLHVNSSCAFSHLISGTPSAMSDINILPINSTGLRGILLVMFQFLHVIY